ncbi:unnamed protein product [Urochloa decumbens]|uniref:DUF7595 domain-containing protein n=1 Tax=Urochloa decumbens TaxID=240449 RepID=A0ABC9F596_9POAL
MEHQRDPKRPRTSDPPATGDDGGGTVDAREPLLPDDLLLEIAARADVATVVRCAAASKPLRRAILGPGFRHRLGPDHAVLLGFSFQPHPASTRTPGVVGITTAPRPHSHPLARIDPSLWESSDPVASRDGLLVLRRKGRDLSVCDTLTGAVTSLPPTDLLRGYFLPALLGAGRGADGCFELLVADAERGPFTTGIRIQTFSSKNGRWSAVRSVPYPEQICLVSRAHPAVFGRLVHWLYRGGLSNPHRVLVVDVDAAAATEVQLPPSYRSRMRAIDDKQAYVRLVAVAGKLSLIVGETTAVSMWTLTASTWSRQVVIGMQELERRAGLRPDMYYFCQTLFLGFAEASGTVAVLMMERHLLTLNLGTKAVTTLWRGGRENRAWASQVCLHEIGLASALQAMKSF